MHRTWKILLIDDDEDDYYLTRHMLSEAHGAHCDLEWVRSFEDGQKVLQKNGHYDAVLMDYDLGSGSGIELIRQATQGGYPAPFVLLTGRGSHEVDVEAMQAGAIVYLTKSEVNSMLLERSIRYAIERNRIERERMHILESIQDGFFALDREWCFSFINRQAAQIVGLEPKELVGRNIWEAFPRLLGTPVEQNYRLVMDERRPVKFEMQGVYLNVWYDISVYPHEQGISVYWQDVTEKRKARQAIRQSEERFSKAFSATPNALVISRLADGLIELINDSFERLFGYERVEVIGKTSIELKMFANPHDREIATQRLRADRSIRNFETDIRLKSGEIRQASLSVEILSTDDDAYILTVIEDITDRKRAEEELKKRYEELEAARVETENQKLRLEAVLEALPVGMAITDARGGSIHANPAYEQVWGGPVLPVKSVDDYAAYQAWWADTGEPLKPDEWASAQAVAKGKAVHGQILEIQRFDGRRGFVLNSASPVRDSNGQIVGSAVAIQDISNLKQAEILNKALIEINQVLLSTLDIEEVMQHALSSSRKALGSESAAISLHRNDQWVISYVDVFPREVVGLKMSEEDEPHAALAIQTQKPVAINDAFNDGRVNRDHMQEWGIRSVLVVPILLREEAVGVMFFNYQTTAIEFQEAHIQFGVNLAASISSALENARLFASLENEIRERQKVEAELRKNSAALSESKLLLHQSEQKFAKAFHSNPTGLSITHLADGRYVDVNDSLCQMFGYSREEMIGHTSLEMDVFVDTVEREELVRRLHEKGGVRNHEMTVRTSSGELRQVLLSIEPIEIDEQPCALGTCIDITKRKRVEAERERLLEENRRQLELRQEVENMLQAYAEKLEQSNRELENFAYVASHDLQEPLRKIESFGQMLAQQVGPSLDETERGYLERMQSAASRMNKMIDDLLNLSRVTIKGQTFSQVDLNQVARDVLDDLEPRIRQVGGQVDLGELPMLEADPVQLHQLLQNLIGNAIKFYKPGQPPIVRVSSHMLPDRSVEILVEDNGIGIEMEQAGRLFQPFQRLHGRSEYEGNGIGLSICRKIAERHGGTITVSSEPGKGSVFSVCLPPARFISSM